MTTNVYDTSMLTCVTSIEANGCTSGSTGVFRANGMNLPSYPVTTPSL